MTTTFDKFNLDKDILKAVIDAGFREPSPVQDASIPLILEGNDIVAQAQTGTGKTAAFGLSTMSMIDPGEKRVQILVITPTRELATQVSDELFSLGKYRNIKTVTIYGGSSYNRQIGLIERGANVVVATPGRMLDLLKNGRLKNFTPKIVVLDEADEMLDMGFLEDIESILKFLPKERQTLLFSATMPEPIKRLAKRRLNDPKFVNITPKEHSTNEDIEQLYYVIEERERDNALIRLLDALEPVKSVIFCRTKKEVDRVSTQLMAIGYSAKGLHGDMEQNQRETVIRAFRSSQIEILVATDVAARGLNVADISHVFNFHMPFDPESYVHRIGRTGRAGKKGTAITLVNPMEYHSMQRIAKKVGTNIQFKMVPTLNDVQESQLKKMANEIEKAELDVNAQKILDILGDDINLSKISLKLISMLINKNSFKGPNKIGFDQKTLSNLVKRLDEKNSRDRNRGGRGRSGGYRGRNRNRSGERSSRSSGNRERRPRNRG